MDSTKRLERIDNIIDKNKYLKDNRQNMILQIFIWMTIERLLEEKTYQNNETVSHNESLSHYYRMCELMMLKLFNYKARQ